VSDGAAELRRAFDELFARAPAGATVKAEELLVVQLGVDRYLLPLADLAGLVADRRLVALPTATPAFRGVVGVRGAIVPAWDLGTLLGYPATERSPKWLAITKTPRIGLAFTSFGGQLKRPSSAGSSADRHDDAHVREAVRIEGIVYRIIDVRSILAAIEKEQR
jgi:purine-binding chemotaxis protein CheW